MLINNEVQGRFTIKKQLGQGSFSTIYSAVDKRRKETVALKVEKSDKSKKILQFEYQVLKSLQGLSSVCPVYEFVESDQPNGSNFIVMKMLGKNLATLKKQKGKSFTPIFAIKLLLQMLEAIERVHDHGYIHRDIKPSNFVLGKGKTRGQVFVVDFGLGKVHLTKDGTPVEQRQTADFRGTVAYASLNAHNKIDLSRRDDLWSWYFVVLDFLNEQLPWRNCKNNKVDDVKELKTKCLAEPEKYIWRTTTNNMSELRSIFYKIKNLKYSDRPDYNYIREQLNILYQKEEAKEQSLRSADTKTSISKKRKSPSANIADDLAQALSPTNKVKKEPQPPPQPQPQPQLQPQPQAAPYQPMMMDAAGLGYRLPYPYPFYSYQRPYPAVHGRAGPGEEAHGYGFPVPLRTPAAEGNGELPYSGRLNEEPANEEARNKPLFAGPPQQRYYMMPTRVPIAFRYPNSTSALPYPYNQGNRAGMMCGNGEEGRERTYFNVEVNRDYYEKLYAMLRVTPQSFHEQM